MAEKELASKLAKRIQAMGQDDVMVRHPVFSSWHPAGYRIFFRNVYYLTPRTLYHVLNACDFSFRKRTNNEYLKTCAKLAGSRDFLRVKTMPLIVLSFSVNFS